MFNVTGGELLLILVMALIVLGPERLPDAARKLGKAVAQLRDLSGSFQKEIRDALEEPSAPVVKPNSRPQLTAIEGGARLDASPIAAAPVDGGESLAVTETAALPSEDSPAALDTAADETAPPAGPLAPAGAADVEGVVPPSAGTPEPAPAEPAGADGDQPQPQPPEAGTPRAGAGGEQPMTAGGTP